jgi:hypothetical protein
VFPLVQPNPLQLSGFRIIAVLTVILINTGCDDDEEDNKK